MSINYTPIRLVPYDGRWPEAFGKRAAALWTALGPVAVRIDHIGSTAVPGLDAKPTIDIQVSAADVDDLDSYRGPIERLGYTFHEDSLGEARHRFFSAPKRSAHVHVCCFGGSWERRHLLFRDYLRAHPEAADRYAADKHRFARLLPTEREAYAEAKSGFIDEEMIAAESWAQLTGWTL